jgi:hypothetical protein
MTAFLEGGPQGTLRVPATATGVVAISGIGGPNQPWSHSSRGPAGDYSVGGTSPPQVPHLAYPVKATSAPRDEGTSFASPRACADTAKFLRGKPAGQTIDDLVNNHLSRPGPALPAWNPRTGYGDVP